MTRGDHPHTDPSDGRTECDVCGKFVWLVTHSCKGVPVTDAAMKRMKARLRQETLPAVADPSHKSGETA